MDRQQCYTNTDFRLWLAKMAGIPEPGWSTGVVQTFLQRLTNVCWAGEDGGGLLCQAAIFADSQIVQVCLAKGVAVNWKGPSGRTALIEALLGDRSQRATDVDGRFLTRVPYVLPRMLKLNSTTLEERKAVVIVLLNHGADPDLGGDLEDGSRRPPLVCAASRGFDWAVKELIERGVDLNARATFLCKPQLRGIPLWPPFRHVPAQHTSVGALAMFYASRGGHISTQQLLLAQGADTSLLDECGKTVLEWASKSGD